MTSEKANENTRKELFDFLRNKQKEAEIHSKVNGVNLWVLLGAIGLVAYQIAADFQSLLKVDQEILLRFILIAETLIFSIIICLPDQGLRNEFRYRKQEWDGPPPAPVILFEIALALAPLILSFKYLEAAEWPKMLPIIFFFFAYEFIENYSRLKEINNLRDGKLPMPVFAQMQSGNWTAASAISVFLIADAVIMSAYTFPKLEQSHLNQAKTIALACALYALLLFLCHQRKTLLKTGWTYELETDLLLGKISESVARERIESKILGAPFIDKMENFFSALDARFEYAKKNRIEFERKASESTISTATRRVSSALYTNYSVEMSLLIADASAFYGHIAAASKLRGTAAWEFKKWTWKMKEFEEKLDSENREHRSRLEALYRKVAFSKT